MPHLIRPILMVVMLAAASAAQAGDAAKGRATAEEFCVRCHVVDPAQTSGSDTAPPFRDVAKNPAWTDAARLMAQLADPHPAMPGFTLSRQEVSNLIAYLATLRE